MEYPIGCIGRDSITGFSGRVIAVAKYITGCNQVLLAPPLSPNGEYVESRWMDFERLHFEPGKIELPHPVGNGGDKQAPRK